jgi:hypothetical protein
MFKCRICGKKIKYQNLEHVFQFTLGNIKSGKFIHENSETYYYHVDCLNELEKIETKLLIPLP